MNKRKNKENLTELQRLNMFVERAEELGSRTYFHGSTGGRLTMGFKEGSDFMNILEKDADEDQLRSFVMSFRLFMLEDDPIFLNGIYNILLRRLPEGELRGLVD